MTVLILTSEPHIKFVADFVRPYRDRYEILIAEETIFDFTYDIGISFMYTHKVPAKEVNTHKWYNFHPAPLPEYKGRNLCYHAILNGEKEFGATLHYMDENFDTGPIIDVWHTTIAPYQTAGDVSREVIETAKVMFSTYLPRILEDFPFATLPNEGGTYYKKEPIDDVIPMAAAQKELIRAIYTREHRPKIMIAGRAFNIIAETE